MLCNLQIFSGCVCHLEQLHAQSPFLFPIVFSINLIPFFDNSSVLAVHSPGLFGYVLLYFTWATARSQELLFVVLACHALRALDSSCRLRTRRRVCICTGSTRCRGNHMHDHSRFQRDIDDVTGVSLSLYYSQKSLTHNIGSASALPIIKKKKPIPKPLLTPATSTADKGQLESRIKFWLTLIRGTYLPDEEHIPDTQFCDKLVKIHECSSSAHAYKEYPVD